MSFSISSFLLLFCLVGNFAFASSWEEVDLLVRDQKFAEALKKTELVLVEARRSRKVEVWCEALVRAAKYRITKGEVEGAISFLQKETWPIAEPFQSILSLAYVEALESYFRTYSWEIRTREKKEGSDDVKHWTTEKFQSEIQQSFAKAWQNRVALGSIPLDHLGGYLQKNNYPELVRPTFRSALSYLYANFLADNSWYSPREAAELHHLSLQRLWNSAVFETGGKASHPLEQSLAVLQDLQKWHAKEGRKEAALESALELSRYLYANFSENSERTEIRELLNQTLASYVDVPWWAMGKYQLALFYQGASDVQDYLVKAVAEAESGRARFPESVGGKNSGILISQIQAPNFFISMMRSDGIKRPSISISSKNLKTLYFRAFRFPLTEILAGSRSANDLWQPNRNLNGVKKGEPVASWTESIAVPGDYLDHTTRSVPQIKENGEYFIEASPDPKFSPTSDVAAGLFSVGNLFLTTEITDKSLEVRAFEGSTGNPLKDVKISLFEMANDGSGKLLKSKLRGITDERGKTTFPDLQSQSGSFWLVGEKDSSRVLISDGLYFYRNQPEMAQISSLIYKDRSVYRPGQKIFWKLISYKGIFSKGKVKTLAQQPVTVQLIDVNGKEVAVVHGVTNSLGTFSGEFTVPAGKALGNWQIRSSTNGFSALRVEEYKRPTFYSELKDSETPLRLERPAFINGIAKYYFGAPVTSGFAKWKVTRTAMRPFWWFWDWGVHQTPFVVASGDAALNSQGEYQFQFLPKGDLKIEHRDGNLKYQFEVEVTLTDSGGETREVRRSYLIGDSSVEVEFHSDVNFFVEGREGKLNLLRKSLDGAARQGIGSWKIYSLKLPAAAQMPGELPRITLECGTRCTEGDKFVPRGGGTDFSWRTLVRDWKVDKELATGAASHDSKGSYALSWPKLSAGVYRLKYETKDEQDANVVAYQDFLVAGSSAKIPVAGFLLAERNHAEVGETVRIWAYTGFDRQFQILKTHISCAEANERLLQSGKDSLLIEIPVSESMRGGLSFSSLFVHDHQMLASTETIDVPWTNKILPLSFSHIREKLRPGDHEKWTISVKEAKTGKKKSEVEVLAWMVDKSLEIFGRNDVPNLLNLFPHFSFYPNRRSSQQITSMNLISSRTLNQQSPTSFTPDVWTILESGGVGGMGRRNSWNPAEYKGIPLGLAQQSAQDSAPAGGAGRMKMIAEGNAASIVSKSSSREAIPANSEMSSKSSNLRAAPTTLRSDFSETAFWKPQLLIDSQGNTSVEFTVPDSVTSWTVNAQALSSELGSGSAERTVVSAKDLMIRPYLPRFFREGDQIELQIVVNNNSKLDLTGNAELQILDAKTNEDLSKKFQLAAIGSSGFHVGADGSEPLRFSLLVPNGIGEVKVKAVAKTKDFADGEIRNLPVLPGRMHLSQSKFVVLKGPSSEVLDFSPSFVAQKDDSRIHEELVVTVQAQLFYNVLQALPYLLNYSYPSMDVQLDRWVSAGILSSIYSASPSLQLMARKFSRRNSQKESWDEADPNRKIFLEESPWLVDAQGGGEKTEDLLNLLNPEVVTKVREESLLRLREMQQPNGGFSWWNGGPASVEMTLQFILESSRGAEFGVELPKEMIQKSWQFIATELHGKWLTEVKERKAPLETMVRLAYALQMLPDLSFTAGLITEADRKEILNYSFENWRKCSPYVKGLLTMALGKANRVKDANHVFASVMDTAKSDPILGIYWAPEDRSWLWYNDTIDTHAFALRVLSELNPHDDRREGLVQWLFLNKKLNHWKSTRATAEVIYSLANYLKSEKAMDAPEQIKVTFGGVETKFEFDPKEFSGKNQQVVVSGEKIQPLKMAKIQVGKKGKGLAFASATWHYSTEVSPNESSGDLFLISRKYYLRKLKQSQMSLEPITDQTVVRVGDEVEVQLSVKAKQEAEYVHLRDPRPAGFEPAETVSGNRWALGISWFEEIRDSATNFFFERLPVGEFPLKYRLRASMPGKFRASPVTVESLYAPEFSANSSGGNFLIQK